MIPSKFDLTLDFSMDNSTALQVAITMAVIFILWHLIALGFSKIF